MKMTFALFLLFFVFSVVSYSQTYLIVDTGQEKCYDNSNEITPPSAGEPFYGQDAQFDSNQPSYTDNGDGTVTDNITGLMWLKSPDLNGDGTINSFDKLTYYEAIDEAESFEFAGYDDWRVPTIKELYSLFMAYGTDPSGPMSGDLIPFLNEDIFPFGWGDVENGERDIDAQYVTSTLYVDKVFENMQGMFGVNFADGRIKGYPTESPNPEAPDMDFYVKFVRGGLDYGENDLVDNADGTIIDNATGLMWAKNDSQEGLNWEEALAWVQTKNSEDYLGYNDWRLPNVKELQSIVDYNRSPSTTNSAAIDPMFNCSQIIDEGDSQDWPFYWSSTTHISLGQQPGKNAMYVAFGRALGFMEMPPNSGDFTLMDVHGAGAQRSDPKTGNPDDYPEGFGPQGDVIRIYNYVRLVRDADPASNINEQGKNEIDIKIYPNPASNYVIINVGKLENSGKINIYNSLGVLVLSCDLSIRTIDISNLPEGMYIINYSGITNKFMVLR